MRGSYAYRLGRALGLAKQAEESSDPFSPDERKHFQMYMGVQPEQMDTRNQSNMMLLGRSLRVKQMSNQLRELYAMPEQGVPNAGQ